MARRTDRKRVCLCAVVFGGATGLRSQVAPCTAADRWRACWNRARLRSLRIVRRAVVLRALCFVLCALCFVFRRWIVFMRWIVSRRSIRESWVLRQRIQDCCVREPMPWLAIRTADRALCVLSALRWQNYFRSIVSATHMVKAELNAADLTDRRAANNTGYVLSFRTSITF